jgi:hypothetical protein
VRKVGNTFSSRWTDRSPSSNSTERNSTDHSTPLFLPAYRLKFPKPRRNSITIPVLHELVAAYDLFDQDDRVRVVVLTADHTAYAFCSGVRGHDILLVTALNGDALLFLLQADISSGWRDLFSEDDERQGRHSTCYPLIFLPSAV